MPSIGKVGTGGAPGPSRVGLRALGRPRWSEDAHARLLLVLANITILALLWLGQGAVGPETMLWLYGLSQCVLYGSHMMYLRRLREADLLDGLNVLNFGFFLHFTLAPFLLFYEVMPGFYTSLWDLEDFEMALVLIQALSVTVQAGYYLSSFGSRGLTFLAGAVSSRRLVALAVVIISLELLGKAAFLAELETLRAVGGGLYIAISTIVVYAPYILIIMRPPNSSLITSLVLSAGTVYAATASLFFGIGSKAGVASVILSYVVYRHYLVKRLGVRHLALGAAIGIGVVVYMNYVRAVGYFGGIEVEAINPLNVDNRQTFWAAGVSSTLTPFEALMVVVRTFPYFLPYQNGRRLFEDMAYPLFPRLFFPDKPEVYGAAFFWEFHHGFLTLDNPIFEAISLPGHLYVDFGVPGVLLAGMTVGLLQRLLYSRLILGASSPAAICLYGILMSYTLIAARAFFWTTHTMIVSVLVPLLLLRLLLTQRQA